MEPITTTVVILYVAQKFLDQFIKDEGYGRLNKLLFPQKKYVNRLVQLISQTVNEYREAHPANLPEGKIAFYQSQVVFEKLTTILLKTKLSSELKFEFNKNPRIEIPSEEQMRCFLDILASKIKNDKELRRLFIQENYQAEIFEISSTLTRIEEKIDTLLNRPSDSAVVATSLIDSYLKDLDYPSDLLQNYKPMQALEYLLKFKSDKWKTSNDLIKYKVLANIGQCYLQLHDQEAASTSFIDAEKFNPDSPKALGFFALGYALANNKSEFERIYNKAIELGDVSTLVYTSLIMMDKGDSSLEELLNKLPETSKNDSQVAFAIARHLKKQGNLKACIEWMQIAIDTDAKGRSELKGILGSYILELVCTPDMFLTMQVTLEERELIKKGIDLLTESWDSMLDYDLRQSNFFMILNRGVGKKFLGDYEGAYLDIKEASTLNQDLVTLRHLAIVSVESGRRPEAIQVFENILKKDVDFSHENGIQLLLADCLIEENRSDDAIPHIKSIIEKDGDERRVNEARSILIDIFIKDNKISEAKSENETILQNFPDKIIGYLNAAHIAKAEENLSEISISMNEAWNRVNDSSDSLEINVLGNNAFVYGEYQIAISCFEKVVNLDVNSDIVKRLIMSYNNLKRFDKVVEICGRLRQNGIYDPAIFDTEISTYQSMSNAPKAIEICEEFLRIDSTHVPMNVRAAFLYFQKRDIQKCKEAVLRVHNLIELPLPAAFSFARLHFELELFQRGLDYLYSLWRLNINVPEVHSLYTNSFLFLPEGALSLLQVLTVKVDSCVTIKINGNHVTYALVETATNVTLNELNVSENLAQKLLNKSVGDTIEIDDSMGIFKTAEIVGIMSKFSFAQKKSMDYIQSTFIENDGPRIITSEGETDEEKRNSMFDLIDGQLENRQERDNQIIDFYKSGAMTIGLFSNSKSINEIEIWTAITNNAEMGVFASTNSDYDQNCANEYLQHTNPIVLDLPSVLALDAINSLHIIEKLQNRLIVSQALIDCCRNYLFENQRIGDLGKMSISKKNGKVVVHQISAEQITSQLVKVQSILDWLTTNCEVLPANNVIRLDQETREQIFQLAGDISAESIILASEHEALLLADEMAVRLIGLEKQQVKGTNGQTFLRSLLGTKRITKQEYDDFTVKLISLNYKGLMIEPSSMLLALQKSNYQVSEPFTKTLVIIEGNNSEENSAIYVSVLFLKQLFLSVQPPSTRDLIVISVLEALVKNRIHQTVILKLKTNIIREFNLLPVQKLDLELVIDSWYNSNDYISN